MAALAEEITFSKYITYMGGVDANGKPSGKGKIEVVYNQTKDLNKDVLEGVFANGIVTDAKLVLKRYNWPFWLNTCSYKGVVEYSIADDGSSITFKLKDGKFKDFSHSSYTIVADCPLEIKRTPHDNGCDLKTEAFYTDVKSPNHASVTDIFQPFNTSLLGPETGYTIGTIYCLGDDWKFKLIGKADVATFSNGSQITKGADRIGVEYPNGDNIIYDISKSAVVSFKKTYQDTIVEYKYNEKNPESSVRYPDGAEYVGSLKYVGSSDFEQKIPDFSDFFKKVMLSDKFTNSGLSLGSGTLTCNGESLVYQDGKSSRIKLFTIKVGEDYKATMRMEVTPVSLPQPTNEFSTPKKAGYTLVYTKTIAGYKCDYYAEGVRTFHFGNGDFATFSDGSKDEIQNRKPYSSERSIGDWQVHTDDGGVIKRENGVITITNPDGTISRTSYTRNLTWGSDEEKPSPESDIPIDIITLPGSTTPLPKVEFTGSDEFLGGFKASGILAGNKIYRCVDGIPYSTHQIVDGFPIPASESDSITGIEICRCKNFLDLDAIKLTIHYANGDSIVSTGTYDPFVVESGSIHRNGGVLTIKVVNNKLVQILTYPNGDKYVGGFSKLQYEKYGDCLLLEDLETKDLKYLNGTLIKANGKRIEYKGGRSEIEIAAEKKADDAKTMARYKQLCAKFGKKYVDAALNKKPVVGMPEELLRRVFTLKLVETGRNYKLYHIIGLGWTCFGKTLTVSALLYSIRVSNGRVTSVQYWKLK